MSLSVNVFIYLIACRNDVCKFCASPRSAEFVPDLKKITMKHIIGRLDSRQRFSSVNPEKAITINKKY